MEDRHVINALRYMERTVEYRVIVDGVDIPVGWSPLEWLVDQRDYVALVKEVKRRGLPFHPPDEWYYSKTYLAERKVEAKIKAKIAKQSLLQEPKRREFNF